MTDLAEDEARAICRQWAWKIGEEAKSFLDHDKQVAVLIWTLEALRDYALTELEFDLTGGFQWPVLFDGVKKLRQERDAAIVRANRLQGGEGKR